MTWFFPFDSPSIKLTAALVSSESHWAPAEPLEIDELRSAVFGGGARGQPLRASRLKPVERDKSGFGAIEVVLAGEEIRPGRPPGDGAGAGQVSVRVAIGCHFCSVLSVVSWLLIVRLAILERRHNEILERVAHGDVGSDLFRQDLAQQSRKGRGIVRGQPFQIANLAIRMRLISRR